jgi:hypothetical protein
MPELAQAASPTGNGAGLCVPRRIYDLRKRGHTIQNVTTQASDGSKHSAYRLMPRMEAA